MTYAEKTKVPAERSRAEIERLLARYGATRFASGWEDGRATIAFAAHGRMVKIILPLPRVTDRAFTHVEPGSKWSRERSKAQAAELWAQEVRRRWRALVLAIKAKLEVVASGISTFETEFLAHVVTQDGRTIGEILGPSLGAGETSPGAIAYPALPEHPR